MKMVLISRGAICVAKIAMDANQKIFALKARIHKGRQIVTHAIHAKIRIHATNQSAILREANAI